MNTPTNYTVTQEFWLDGQRCGVGQELMLTATQARYLLAQGKIAAVKPAAPTAPTKPKTSS